jgi:hypothetical protein
LRNLIHSAACAVALGSMLPYSAFAWQSTPAQTMAMQQYVKTAPYVDLPLPQLKKAIRDLNGIKPDSTPGQLEVILEKTGEAITLQLPRVPNLICREDVADEAPPKQESSDGMAKRTAKSTATPGTSSSAPASSCAHSRKHLSPLLLTIYRTQVHSRIVIR